MKARIAVLACGLVAALLPASACTLMKPSHEELSGGSGFNRPDAAQTDALSELPAEDVTNPEAGSDVVGDVTTDADGAVADVQPEADAPDAADAADAQEAEAGLACEAGLTACGNQCVSADDPAWGCGSGTCAPCALANAVAGCGVGFCSIVSCTGVFTDCDNVPLNGCEADLQNDPQNCSACGSPCTTLPNMTAPCAAGVCGDVQCLASHQDCNADLTDGCETHTDGDPANCGSCWQQCPAQQNATPACAAGQCALECLTGFGDCNNNTADGCEVSTSSSTSHCGACNKACPSYFHATAACQSGTCKLGSCDALWGNCNGVTADGCETSLALDKANCGTCNNVCTGGKKCVNGVCQ
jgi:hypothetical protein